ncbi:MAG: FG-GAP-like repeat-containing protein [Draconibacterium sp.]
MRYLLLFVMFFFFSAIALYGQNREGSRDKPNEQKSSSEIPLLDKRFQKNFIDHSDVLNSKYGMDIKRDRSGGLINKIDQRNILLKQGQFLKAVENSTKTNIVGLRQSIKTNLKSAQIENFDGMFEREFGGYINGELWNNAFYGSVNQLSVDFGDLDGDGNPDILQGSRERMEILWNDGTNNFLLSAFGGIINDANEFWNPCLVDIDGDGDLDLYSGKLGGEITYWENTGTQYSPSFISETETGIVLGGYADPEFIDIDADHDYDLIIGDQNSIYLFWNIGDSLNPVFSIDTTGILSSLSLSGYVYSPEFCDIDGDGDFDLFVSNEYGNIRFFENTGNSTNPVFTLNTSEYAGIFQGWSDLKINFQDIDNDNDFDLFLTDLKGYFYFYENTGSNTIENWELQSSMFTKVLNFGRASAPAIGDIDNDGDNDLLFGDGVIMQNVGSITDPYWSVDEFLPNNPDFIFNTPELCDIDADGDLDLFYAENSGYIRFYENFGTPESPNWIVMENNFPNGLNLGSNTHPSVSFTDVDNDGDKDMFLQFANWGTYPNLPAGTDILQLYRNTGTPQSPNFVLWSNDYYPIRDYGIIFGRCFFKDIDNDGDADYISGSGDGAIHLFENTGNSSVMTLSYLGIVDYVDDGRYSSPILGDLDGNGNPEIISGVNGGGLNLWRNTSSVKPCNPLDSLALVAFYHATGGDGWNDNTNWLFTPVQFWHGITVENGRVSGIDLNSNNLNGELPSEMQNLDSLKSLLIYNNNLSGELEPLRILQELNYIVCDNNNFSGSLSPLFNKVNNYWISFENNQLSGAIDSLSQLQQLRGLFLNGNLFSGAIPPELGQLQNLEYLYLYQNAFSGSIPAEVGNMASLERLYLNQNNLSGSIPATIGNLSNLLYLGLYSNNLSGEIPAEIGNLSNLYYLGLFENQLSGNIPDQLYNLSHLGILSIRNNNFDGIISAGIGQLSSLSALRLEYNNFTGSIPEELCNIPLADVNFEQNYFDEGSCPAVQCLIQKNVDFAGDTLQTQKNDLALLELCSFPSLQAYLLSPTTSNGTLCNPSDGEPVTVHFFNDGNKPVSGLELWYTVGGDTITFETYADTIYPGDSIIFEFNIKADLSSPFYKYYNTLNIFWQWDDSQFDYVSLSKQFLTYNFEESEGWTTYNGCNGLPNDVLMGLAEDRNGNVWTVSNSGAARFDGKNWVEFNEDGMFYSANKWTVFKDNTYNLTWFAGDKLMYTYGTGSIYSYYTFSYGTYSECSFQDAEGWLWFGSGEGNGVVKYLPGDPTYYLPYKTGLGTVVTSITEDGNGIMYFATNTGIVQFDGATWSNYELPVSTSTINRIFFDSSENMWFTSGTSIIQFNGSDWLVYSDPDSIVLNCNTIIEDFKGNIWFGGGKEIVKYDGHSWTKYGIDNGMVAAMGGDVTSLLVSKGDIWIGTDGGGISVLDQPYENIGILALGDFARNPLADNLYCGLTDSEEVTVSLCNDGDFTRSGVVGCPHT